MSGFGPKNSTTTKILTGDEAFRASPVATALFDLDCVVRAANPAFTKMTGRSADTLISLDAFEAFPDNPDNPEADGVARMRASFERVFTTGIADNMIIQRYDIADLRSGEFVQRHWVPINSPVFHEGRLIGIRQQVKDATVLRADALRVMEHYRDVMNGRSVTNEQMENHQAIVNAFTDGITQYRDLEAEVAQLREALASRATIEQAKGMLMVTRRCSADEAFELLRGLSQDTNVRLADVAAALIYQLQTAN